MELTRLNTNGMKTKTKTITKPITKPITKTITKPITKTITKTITKPITKTITKRITKPKGKNTKKKSLKKNRSLVGELPDFNNSASEIKMSKKGLRKILKALFSDMGLEEKETIKMLKNLGKDEQSVHNLTKFINKTKKNDLKRKTDVIRNMNQLKDSILTIYKLFDQLNNNLGILFERKKS